MSSSMRTLTVDLGDRAYPIFIGTDLIADASALYRPHIHGSQVMIVSNETVAPLYLARGRGGARRLPAGTRHSAGRRAVQDARACSTSIYTALLQNRFDRRCTLLALGGGVVGDMTGYAAASYQRGVNFIQVPTTLLSQVDSSVGGKTGVNHPLGKNMIGAFHQPQCVIVDISTLDTLPDRELSAGLAEVIKYGLIDDREFFDWLEHEMPATGGA